MVPKTRICCFEIGNFEIGSFDIKSVPMDVRPHLSLDDVCETAE